MAKIIGMGKAGEPPSVKGWLACHLKMLESMVFQDRGVIAKLPWHLGLLLPPLSPASAASNWGGLLDPEIAALAPSAALDPARASRPSNWGGLLDPRALTELRQR